MRTRVEPSFAVVFGHQFAIMLEDHLGAVASLQGNSRHVVDDGESIRTKAVAKAVLDPTER